MLCRRFGFFRLSIFLPSGCASFSRVGSLVPAQFVDMPRLVPLAASGKLCAGAVACHGKMRNGQTPVPNGLQM